MTKRKSGALYKSWLHYTAKWAILVIAVVSVPLGFRSVLFDLIYLCRNLILSKFGTILIFAAPYKLIDIYM